MSVVVPGKAAFRTWKYRGVVSPDGGVFALEDWKTLMARQGAVCALCERPFSSRSMTPHLDHDHATGRARGILHHACNARILASVERLGRLRGTDAQEALTTLAVYLAVTTTTREEQEQT
ncbi:MAG: endonuclease domain-containing protein [bacterium]